MKYVFLACALCYLVFLLGTLLGHIEPSVVCQSVGLLMVTLLSLTQFVYWAEREKGQK